MLKISTLKQYNLAIQQAIPAIKKQIVVVTPDELVNFMREHKAEDNILMIAIVPDHGVAGEQDKVQWENNTGYYFLEKTDSKIKHDDYLAVFERTQDVVEQFVTKLLTDKSDNAGIFCNFLSFLEEESISPRPVKGMADCNGYFVPFSFRSRF